MGQMRGGRGAGARGDHDEVANKKRYSCKFSVTIPNCRVNLSE